MSGELTALVPDPVSRAWQAFGRDDKLAALALASQAFDAHPSAHAAAALGYFLLDANQGDAARDVLQSALQQSPAYAPLHWYMGLLHQRMGEPRLAADALRRACFLDGSLDEAAFNLAWVLHDLGELGEALAWAQKALLSSRQPQRLLQTGWLEQRLGNCGDAVRLYEEAIAAFSEDAPEQSRLHVHLAQSQVALAQRDLALQTLRHGLEKRPCDPGLTAAFADLCWELGQRGQAITVAKAWVDASPDQPDAWHLLGKLHHLAGNLTEADRCFNEVQQRDMTNVDALLRRAQIQAVETNGEASLWLVEQVLRQRPAPQVVQLARTLKTQALLDLKRTREARRHILGVLRAEPRQSELWRLLSVAHRQEGRHVLARRTLARALRLDGSSVEALRMLGWMALEQQELQTARDTVRRLLALVPGDVMAKVQAAFVLAAVGDLADASVFAQDAVAQAPENAEAWRAFADVRFRQRRLSEAESAIEMALALEPDRIDSLRQLGWIQISDNRFGQAQLAFLRAHFLAPDDLVSLLELAEVWLRAGEFIRSLDVIEELLRQQPNHPAGLLKKARVLAEGEDCWPKGREGALGICRRLLSARQCVAETAALLVRLVGLETAGARDALSLLTPGECQAALRDGVADAVVRHGYGYLQCLVTVAEDRFPLDPWIATAGLYSASLSDKSTAASLAFAARDWYRALKIRVGLNNRIRAVGARARKGARVRIAYIAGQLHQSLLRRVLAGHDPEETEVFVFTNHALPPLPRHIHQEALVLESLADCCTANRIDVVIDAGGLHPFEGQMGLLEAYAHRLAPLQVGWLGAWGTAGGLFDVLLTDVHAAPVGEDACFEEALWRIDGGQWSWDPPVHAPDAAPLPASRKGFVTFGVTARGLRLNPSTLDAWAAVLLAVPRAQIHFIGEMFHDRPQRNSILSTFRAKGVDESRVVFDPSRSYEGLLDWLQEIDVVLDSFPGNGGLSLLDPLWMGVPVVSWKGAWPGARQAFSVLAALGAKNWAADSSDEFVATAVALASDLQALARHRKTLRSRFMNSPLVNGRRIAQQIEHACLGFLQQLDEAEASADPKAQVRSWSRRLLLGWLAKEEVTIDLPEIPKGSVPDISVVVVLYNQAGLTRKTLQALADQRGVAFETIIVDNASSDETPSLLTRVRGARVISNEANRGFLLAANQAAALAEGRHLVFLNSDAILQRGALKAACARLDAEPSIGAVGGRIVLTSGGLQEAGNRIFRDGSTLGIGRESDPFCPAAMASRSTDYVSGVFLAVPRMLWRMLGGFDECFAPAYYEDTDFCLRVWKAGFRVVYDPAVLVEHLEWGSALGEAAPRQMRENQQRFLSLHREWIGNQPSAFAQSLEGDRWASPQDHPRRPRILIIDNEVPHMVKGGGLPRARLMLQSLKDWPVTFFPLWQTEDDWRDVYASLPSSVEVMLGYGMGRLEAFLEQRRGVYDVLVVSRPPNLQALQPLRQRRPDLFCGMRMVYDAEALFALREIAEAAVKGKPLSRAQANARLTKEVDLARGSSQVLVVSERDARCFAAAGHRITILSHAIAARRSAPGPRGRSGLLFVGALHPDTPNEDGLIWFIDKVMPRLRSLLPDPPVLTVVGINRSNRLSELASSHVRLLGPVQALEPLYDCARVFVAPVRFAGGVPAKVIEAAAQGVPVVASAVLARQLGWNQGLDIQSARNEETFALGIARLLRDDELWSRQQVAAWNQCAARYDPERFGLVLRNALSELPLMPL